MSNLCNTRVTNILLRYDSRQKNKKHKPKQDADVSNNNNDIGGAAGSKGLTATVFTVAQYMNIAPQNMFNPLQQGNNALALPLQPSQATNQPTLHILGMFSRAPQPLQTQPPPNPSNIYSISSSSLPSQQVAVVPPVIASPAAINAAYINAYKTTGMNLVSAVTNPRVAFTIISVASGQSTAVVQDCLYITVSVASALATNHPKIKFGLAAASVAYDVYVYGNFLYNLYGTVSQLFGVEEVKVQSVSNSSTSTKPTTATITATTTTATTTTQQQQQFPDKLLKNTVVTSDGLVAMEYALSQRIRQYHSTSEKLMKLETDIKGENSHLLSYEEMMKLFVEAHNLSTALLMESSYKQSYWFSTYKMSEFQHEAIEDATKITDAVLTACTALTQSSSVFRCDTYPELSEATKKSKQALTELHSNLPNLRELLSSRTAAADRKKKIEQDHIFNEHHDPPPVVPIPPITTTTTATSNTNNNNDNSMTSENILPLDEILQICSNKDYSPSDKSDRIRTLVNDSDTSPNILPIESISEICANPNYTGTQKSNMIKQLTSENVLPMEAIAQICLDPEFPLRAKRDKIGQYAAIHRDKHLLYYNTDKLTIESTEMMNAAPIHTAQPWFEPAPYIFNVDELNLMFSECFTWTDQVKTKKAIQWVTYGMNNKLYKTDIHKRRNVQQIYDQLKDTVAQPNPSIPKIATPIECDQCAQRIIKDLNVLIDTWESTYEHGEGVAQHLVYILNDAAASATTKTSSSSAPPDPDPDHPSGSNSSSGSNTGKPDKDELKDNTTAESGPWTTNLVGSLMSNITRFVQFILGNAYTAAVGAVTTYSAFQKMVSLFQGVPSVAPLHTALNAASGGTGAAFNPFATCDPCVAQWDKIWKEFSDLKMPEKPWDWLQLIASLLNIGASLIKLLGQILAAIANFVKWLLSLVWNAIKALFAKLGVVIDKVTNNTNKKTQKKIVPSSSSSSSSSSTSSSSLSLSSSLSSPYSSSSSSSSSSSTIVNSNAITTTTNREFLVFMSNAFQ